MSRPMDVWRLATIILATVLMGIPGYLLTQSYDFGSPMRHFTTRDGLTSDQIDGYQPFLQDEAGYMWIGTRNGLNRFDGTEFIQFTESDNDTTTILGQLINAVYEDHAGQIWAGSWTRGLSSIDPRTLAVTRYDLAPHDTARTSITCIFEDPEKYLYVGYNSVGLTVLDPRRQQVARILTYQDSQGLEAFNHYQNTYRAAIPDHDRPDRFWIPSLHGLVEFNASDRSSQYHFTRPDQIYRRENDRLMESMRFVHQSPDSHLWISTWAGVLLEFDPATNAFTSYPCTFNNAPCGPIIGTLSVSPDSILVASPTTGLLMFDRRSGAFSLLNPDAEIRPWPMRPYSLYRDRLGNIWISTIDAGIYILPAVRKPGDPVTPLEPRLTAFNIFDDVIDTLSQAWRSGAITLSHEQNFFSIEYSAFDPEFRLDKEFSYIMEGVNQDWVMAGQRRYVSFTNLDGGKYVFKLRVRRTGENWSDRILTLQIRIIPPLWEKPWFWPFVGILLIGLLLAFYQSRIKRIRTEVALKASFEKQLAEVEMQALRAQMNPHFLFNSLNSIKYYVVEESPVKAAGYIDRFSRLIRLVLQNSREKLIPLSSELEALELYIEIEQLRFEHAFAYTMDVQAGLDTHYYKIPPLLLQPYVENAIWHGLMHRESPGHLQIAVTHEHEDLKIVIEDNGIGRQQAALLSSRTALKKNSLGMKLTSDRMKMSESLHGLFIDVDVMDLLTGSGHAAGTRVVIAIKAKKPMV